MGPNVFTTDLFSLTWAFAICGTMILIELGKRIYFYQISSPQENLRTMVPRGQFALDSLAAMA